jgi:hypothetical protein
MIVLLAVAVTRKVARGDLRDTIELDRLLNKMDFGHKEGIRATKSVPVS